MSAEVVPRSALRPRGGRVPSDLTRGIAKKVGRAIADHGLIEDGDHVMVCVSGGKDSYALLDVLLDLRGRAPVDFSITVVNVDQGWPGYRTDLIEEHIASRDVPYKMVIDNFAPIVEKNIPAGKTPCSLCSRLRRGVLYNLALSLGATKIALGHHRDDLIETLMLNLFFAGKLSSMPALLRSDDGKNKVIRPMAYVPEEWLAAASSERGYPIVRCGCPSCGLPEQKRQVIKRLLTSLEESHPGLKDHMLAALRNVTPSHLLDSTVVRRTT